MRRVSLAILAALFFFGLHSSGHVFAITYAAGWNLVAGPEGSRLTGASGSIFTMQPGDTDYESFPADSPLHGGWGYWANFPSGGSITFGNGQTTFTVTPVPGQYVIIGNPGTAEARVTGADQVTLYTPSGGYRSSSIIPPGQGAWLAGTDTVIVTVSSQGASGDANPPAASAPPPAVPRVSATTNITTWAGLKASSVQSGDIPGYALQKEFPSVTASSAVLADYEARFFQGTDPNKAVVIDEYLLATGTAEFAYQWGIPAILGIIRDNPENYNIRDLGTQAIGDIDRAVRYSWTTPDGDPAEDYVEIFVRGNVVVVVDCDYVFGLGSLSTPIVVARTIDSRINGRRGSVSVDGLSADSAASPGQSLDYVSAPVAHRSLSGRRILDAVK